MSAQEMLAQIDRHRLGRLAPVLAEGESPVAMVPAQSVAVLRAAVVRAAAAAWLRVGGWTLAAALALAGCAGSSYEEGVAGDQSQYDAEAETEAWPAAPEPAAVEPPVLSEYEVRADFEYGWEMSCNDVFAYTPDGNRYYDDIAYNYDDCVGLLEVDVAQLIEALADSHEVSGDAQTLGRSAALDAVFEQLASVLCYGQDCVTRGDFAPY
jgi:hypothetical protein